MLKFLKSKKKSEKKKKGFFRELFDDILFALIAVTIIRGLFIEAYAIPTGSMENSMLIGDHLFVSKVHFGPRSPRTLIQFPLAHQDFWGTGIPSYSDLIELPSFRLPGLRKPKVGEPVVFNYPPDYKKGFPIDMKTFYVKRCLSTPGDTLQIINKQTYVNGQVVEDAPGALTGFFVETDKGVHQRYMREVGITDYYDENPVDTYSTNALPNYSYKGKIGFFINATHEQADQLAKYPFITSVIEVVHEAGELDGDVLMNRELGWTRDNFGPLVMPEKGMTIALTPENVKLYGEAIKEYEGNDNVDIQAGTITIDGQPISEYTFKQGYYFMIGDNRHNSADSRSWGFVPYDHIVGKPLFIFWSVDRTDPNASFFDKLRFNRILDLIK
jgi:signal peptidase I